MTDESPAVEPKGRATWGYVAAVLVLVLVGAGVWFWMQQRGEADDATLSSLDSGTEAEDNDEGTDAPGAPGSTLTTAPTGATPGATPGSPVPMPGKPGGSGQGTGATPSNPGQPAENGAELTTITAPPPSTIAMLQVPDGFDGAAYSITFRPFGPASTGPTGLSMVINISEMKPVSGRTEDIKDLTGQNAVCGASQSIVDAVQVGGTYRGVLELRAMGDVATLTLTRVEGVD